MHSSIVFCCDGLIKALGFTVSSAALVTTLPFTPDFPQSFQLNGAVRKPSIALFGNTPPLAIIRQD
jgi:hypothetical protein